MLNRKSLYKYIDAMGKRNFRKNKAPSKKGFRSRDNDRESWSETVKENEKWEKYYKALKIVPEEEWDEFKKYCQESLPLTFRITGSRAHATEIKKIFIENHVNKLKDEEFEGVKLIPKNLAYYPNQLGWQLNVSKAVIRKNDQFAKTQRFLVIETDVGNISRQEAVSMIPPLLMDVKPHHYVLDMCAAPGSKTAQLVEALHSNDDEGPPTGFVLANDSDYKRSHMLVHQVKRLNSVNFMVVNHDAQLFPKIKLNDACEFLKFDRILCDVPCSGDGTMRKNVNVWKDFTLGNALGLHSLQVNILMRGLQLLRKGGRLVYSTCSLSPVENEAVVAAALRKWGNQVKLADCSQELPGLNRRNGMSEWLVFGKDMEVRERGANDVAETVFPPMEDEKEKFSLERCLRVYPHLQNTGGFFIAVFEKLNPDSSKRPTEDDQEDVSKKQKLGGELVSNTQASKQSKRNEMKKERLPRDANEEPFIFVDPNHEQIANCWSFYDFNENFPRNTILVRNATGEPLRTIYFVSPIIKGLLTAEEQKLKIIHAGIKLFVSQRNDTGNCPWRIQNEALHTVRPLLGQKRQLTCNLNLMKFLFQEAFPKVEAIKELGIDEEFSKGLDKISEGCLFLTVNRDNDSLEDLFLPLWKGKTNVNLMVNKKDTQELLLRVFGIETSSKDEGKEAKYQKKAKEEREAREINGATDAPANGNRYNGTTDC